ncbi:uncharacterized protein Ga0609869_002066 [Rhodovulum iodosum]|uniref:Phytase-like domain-containing protein n=1 Tax=Rhodovulum iodosum TaxID=68291 RepID=A0ABV3XWL6_9RHOB|nr:SdiA-regulated domain-containing protein [Rhodovulum robiginosum]RSK32152.1 hypothetical protein EJA01_13095 [Rhodovulum robiginosum]
MRAALRSGAAIATALWAAVLPAAEAQSTDPGKLRPPASLSFLRSYPLHDKKAGLTEPSGLMIGPGSDGLWTVSDDTRRLFRLDAQGQVIEVGPKIDALVDLEGIALGATGRRILVLSEEHAEIVAIDRHSPQRAERFALREMTGSDKLAAAMDGDLDKLSPEGIAVDTETGAVLVVNERAPRLLIRISPDLDEIVSVLPLGGDRGFVAHGMNDHRLDASGLAHDAARGGIWIASDTGRCVFYLAEEAGPALRFDFLWRDGDKVRPIENAEGIALDASGKTLFVVSDDGTHSRLFIYGVD